MILLLICFQCQVDLLYMSIFISYRREGGKHIADDIYSILCKEYDIFLDTESLKNGYFDTAIVEEIKKCSDFIVLNYRNCI